MLKRERLDRRILFLALAFQALLFYSFYSREIAWYPPLNYDQAVFLTDAYRLQAQVLSKGPGMLWKAIWSTGHYSGLFLPIEGAIMGLIFPSTRLPQLSINLMAFAALQLVAFGIARKVWDRIHAYILLGLILCQTTAWF